MPEVKTIDDVLSADQQIKSFGSLMAEIPRQEAMYGKTDEELQQSVGRPDERSFLGKILETVVITSYSIHYTKLYDD